MPLHLRSINTTPSSPFKTKSLILQVKSYKKIWISKRRTKRIQTMIFQQTSQFSAYGNSATRFNILKNLPKKHVHRKVFNPFRWVKKSF